MPINPLRIQRKLVWVLILFFAVFAVQFSFAKERFQTTPGSFKELDIRYASIRDHDFSSFLDRPWYAQDDLVSGSFLFQLTPSLQTINGSNYTEISSWFQFALSDQMMLINEMQMQHATDIPENYVGKEWRSISGQTKQAFIYWQNKPGCQNQLSLKAGRFYHQSGPGRHGQLLLGAAIRPLDQVNFSLSRQILPSFNLGLQQMTAALDKMNGSSRNLSMHRLSLTGRNWYVAISEALLYARDRGGLDPVYLNPFIFYHLVQLNGPGLQANTLGTIDAGYRMGSHQIHTEILIDDVQFDNEVKGDLEPNEIGILLGYEYAAPKYYAGLEGIAISNRTYKTSDPSEWFIHRGNPIGYSRGSDLAHINAFLRYYVNPNWHVHTSLDLNWQGEGNLDHPWDTPWLAEDITMETGYSEAFPTGVVESNLSTEINILRHWSQERWVSLGLTYHNTKNAANVEGETDSGFNVSLAGSWSFEYHTIFE